MTPLEKAQQILDGIKELALVRGLELPGLPSKHYAQVGNQVIACPGVTVTVIGSNPQPLSPVVDTGVQGMVCDYGELGIFNLVIARDCGHVANDDGTDNPAAIAKISPEMDSDGTLLWDYCVGMNFWLSKSWTKRFVIEGGLAVSSVQLTTGID